MIQKILNPFGDVFNGIGYFKGTFSLQLKPDTANCTKCTIQACSICALQKLFKEELEHLQKMDIINTLGVNEIVQSGVIALCGYLKQRVRLDYV